MPYALRRGLETPRAIQAGATGQGERSRSLWRGRERRVACTLIVAATALCGCDDSAAGTDAEGPLATADAASADAEMGRDAAGAAPAEAGLRDSSAVDAGDREPPEGGGARDAGELRDAPPAADAGPQRDTGTGADAGQPPNSGRTCEGNQWANDVTSLAALADCSVITGNLSVTGSFATLDLPLLHTIDGFLTIWSCANLSTVELPALARIGGYLDVSFNDTLTRVAFPALSSVNERMIFSVHDVAIKDNALLPTCQAETIRDQLVARGYRGKISITGNGGTCVD